MRFLIRLFSTPRITKMETLSGASSYYRFTVEWVGLTEQWDMASYGGMSRVIVPGRTYYDSIHHNTMGDFLVGWKVRTAAARLLQGRAD